MSFLKKKWEKEHDYRLRKTLWAFDEDKIAVRFEYEFHDSSGKWYRAHGNEVSSHCHICIICMLHVMYHFQVACFDGPMCTVMKLKCRYGLQNWKFDEKGYMKERWASINDVPIQESERQFRWPRQ